MKLANYIRLWFACVRYSVVRSMMFRLDFIMWSIVEFLWMGVNVALVAVIYEHTDSVAGWSKYQMMLLIGTSMIIQRLMMGFFWSNVFELGRNVRSGNFDFFLAQPGNVLFMVSTRKLDLDSLANVVIAIGLVIYSLHQLHVTPGALQIVAYVLLLTCSLAISYSLILLAVSLTFWIIKTEGIEGSYFSLTEFSRLPRQAVKSVIINVAFVYVVPVVVISNIPASTLLHGITLQNVLWLAGAAVCWFSLAVFVFNRGLRRYASASS
jgi:ABC-2 type transport system permease protein